MSTPLVDHVHSSERTPYRHIDVGSDDVTAKPSLPFPFSLLFVFSLHLTTPIMSNGMYISPLLSVNRR